MSVKARLFALFSAFALTFSLVSTAGAIATVVAPGANSYAETMCGKVMLRNLDLIPADVLETFEAAFVGHIWPATVGSMYLGANNTETVTTADIKALTSMLDIVKPNNWAPGSYTQGDLTSIILGKKVAAFEEALRKGVDPVAVALLFSRLELNLGEFTIRKGLPHFRDVYNRVIPPEQSVVEVTEDLLPGNVMATMYPSTADMGPSGNFLFGSSHITTRVITPVEREIDVPAAEYFAAAVSVLKTFIKTSSPKALEEASGGTLDAEAFKVMSTLYRKQQLQDLAREYKSMSWAQLKSYAEFFTEAELNSVKEMAADLADGETLPVVFDNNNRLHRLLQSNYPLIKKLLEKTQTSLAYALSMVPESQANALTPALLDARIVLRNLVSLYGLNLRNVGVTSPLAWWERMVAYVVKEANITPIHPAPKAIPVLKSTTNY